MTLKLHGALCEARFDFRQARVLQAAGTILIALSLGGCSYQLGSLVDQGGTTGSIAVQPMRPGTVDPNPTDPFRADTGKTAQAIKPASPG